MPINDVNHVRTDAQIPLGTSSVKDTGAGKAAAKTDAARLKNAVETAEVVETRNSIPPEVQKLNGETAAIQAAVSRGHIENDASRMMQAQAGSAGLTSLRQLFSM